MIPLSLSQAGCRLVPSGWILILLFHITVRQDLIHDDVVRHRNGFQLGSTDKSQVIPISSWASSAATFKSAPVGDEVHICLTISWTHEQHCEVYGSQIPKLKSLTGACLRTVGIDNGIIAFGKPNLVTGAKIYLHSFCERVRAGSENSIHFAIVVLNAIQTSPPQLKFYLPKFLWSSSWLGFDRIDHVMVKYKCLTFP